MNIIKKIALIATIALCGQQVINASWLDAGKSLATSVFNTAVKPVCKTAVQTVAKQNKVVIGLGALTAACAIGSVKNFMQYKRRPTMVKGCILIDLLIEFLAAGFVRDLDKNSKHALLCLSYGTLAIMLGTCTSVAYNVSYMLS